MHAREAPWILGAWPGRMAWAHGLGAGLGRRLAIRYQPMAIRFERRPAALAG